MNVCQMHENLCHQDPPSADLCQRLLLLHLGQTGCMVADDFTQYFLYLSRRFRTFASCIPEYQALSPADRDYLLLSNTPLYLHLHLARYINATGSGRRQIEALVGTKNACSNAATIGEDELLSMSFTCFAESLGIFIDSSWAELLACNASKLSKMSNSLLEPDATGALAACILFYQDKSFGCYNNLDSPNAINYAYENFCHQAAGGRPGNKIVNFTMDTLKSMAHLYAKHSTVNSCSSGDSRQQQLSSYPASFALDLDDINLEEPENVLLVGLLFVDCVVDPKVFKVIRSLLRKRVIWLLSMSSDLFPDFANIDDLDKATDLILLMINSLGSGEEQLGGILGRKDRAVWNMWFGECSPIVFKKVFI
jgi:hypothetical protein